MGFVTGLTVGQQTAAAEAVVKTATQAQSTLKTMRSEVTSHAPGFVGDAATALGAVLDLWGDSADRLPGVLHGYATALREVDTETAQTDADDSQKIKGAGSRLPSGLNIW